MVGIVDSHHSKIETLNNALLKMKTTSSEAYRCCDQLAKRAHQLDSLTSPAHGTSNMLSRANNNLAATLVLMKDAREKFDTVIDCEPAIERLYRGVDPNADYTSIANATHERRKRGDPRLGGPVVLTEQDVYAAGDSMEILRDSYDYFMNRMHYKSSPVAIKKLERVHEKGVDAMQMLINRHLTDAGHAVRPKRSFKRDQVNAANETSVQTRERLSLALQNRDLLKSIGDFEEYQPVESRSIREIRAIFECLGCFGYFLKAPPAGIEPTGFRAIFGIPPNKVLRSEKVGSGCYTGLTRQSLETGFPQLDAYGTARREVAWSSIDSYYRRIKQDRKKNEDKDKKDKGETNEGANAELKLLNKADRDADAAACDACRCLEHAMVVVAGEKNVYRSIIAPFITKPNDEDDSATSLSPYLRKACVAAYSHAVAAVVDRALDIIETVFLKEGGIGQAAAGAKSGDSVSGLSVRTAANAAAAGLRILDGVRMLGPSLAKLCEMPTGEVQKYRQPGNAPSSESNNNIAAILCIAIHRTTVKNAARTLENLAKAIQDDPLKGMLHRPKDASVSIVTMDTMRAIRLVSPFASAYKSVSKRRALPWDPNMGEEAGELDSFVRFLVMRLLNSLKGKAMNYQRDGMEDSQAKSNLFLINNCHKLLKELGPNYNDAYAAGNKGNNGDKGIENYRIESSWFVDKVTKIMDSEKQKYLGHWEVLNTHLTAVGQDDIEYRQNDMILTLESGRLIKNRFSGFNNDFITIFNNHKKLCVIDQELRTRLHNDVMNVFLPRYRRFFEKYEKIRFSKRKQAEYTQYSPALIEQMIPELYVEAEPLPQH